MVGDALAGFRPHTAASTSQAAFDAIMTDKMFRGRIEKARYDEQVIDYAKSRQEYGVEIGQRSQFERHQWNRDEWEDSDGDSA